MKSIYDFWTVPDNPSTKTNCLVVLSYTVKNKNLPTLPTRAAIKLAYVWQKKFPASFVIVSTGDNQKLGVPNSRVMKNYAVRIGIPENRIIEENKSLTTLENLNFSRETAGKRGFKNITLVLYDLHTRRSLKIAQKINWSGVHWISATSKGEGAYGIKYFQTFSRFTILIYEAMAYLYNKIRGEI